MAAITGELAVEFNLPDTDARLRGLSEFHRLGPVVLLFQPTAYGLRSRLQFWSLLRHYDHFVELAAEIVVVTGDPLPEARILQIRRGLPFVFLSDRNGTVAQTYGVEPGECGGYVITVGGMIRYQRCGRRCSGTEMLHELRRLAVSELIPQGQA